MQKTDALQCMRKRLLLSLAACLPVGCGVVVVHPDAWVPLSQNWASENVRVHQGYASGSQPGDDSMNYFFDTTALYLSSSPHVLKIVASNHAVLLSGTSHMGDGDAYDGKVFGVIEHWTGCQNSSAPIFIVIFDGQTLQVTKTVDITGDLPEASGIAIDPDTSEAILTSFCDSHNLYVYRMSDWTLTRTIPLSIPVPGIQGAAYRQGFLYIGDAMGNLYRYNFARGSMQFYFRASMKGEYEGLDFHNSELRWLLNGPGDSHILLSYSPVQ